MEFWSTSNFKVALSRTLTEILQGKHEHNVNFSDFSFEKIENGIQNKIQAFKDGTAVYPISVWKKNHFQDDVCIQNHFKDNTEMLKHICDDLENLGHDILVL